MLLRNLGATGKGSSLAVTANEFIQQDAAPLDLVSRPEQARSGDGLFSQSQAGRQFQGHRVPIRFVHGNLRLTKKVTDQLRGIIPAGVFEIDEAQIAVGSDQGVVEAKVRRGKASLGEGQRGGAGMSNPAGAPENLEA